MSTIHEPEHLATLSSDGRCVVCGAPACSQAIASVVARGRTKEDRELSLYPAWEPDDDGSWRPTPAVCKKIALGYSPGNRRRQRKILNTVLREGVPVDGPKAGKTIYGHFGSYVTTFPAVVYCCHGHRNVLEAAPLRVLTDAERARRNERTP